MEFKIEPLKNWKPRKIPETNTEMLQLILKLRNEGLSYKRIAETLSKSGFSISPSCVHKTLRNFKEKA